MKQRREPLFLARQSYRRRRLEDAARLLPILGMLLFLIPFLAPGVGTARQGLFLFSAWFGLILLTAFISYWLRGWPGLGRSTSSSRASNTSDQERQRRDAE